MHLTWEVGNTASHFLKNFCSIWCADCVKNFFIVGEILFLQCREISDEIPGLLKLGIPGPKEYGWSTKRPAWFGGGSSVYNLPPSFGSAFKSRFSLTSMHVHARSHKELVYNCRSCFYQFKTNTFLLCNSIYYLHFNNIH